MTRADDRTELLEAAPDPSLRYGLVGALRFPGDEVQFGRVLHALCRSNEEVANDFCGAVLELAAAGEVASRRRRARKLLSDLRGQAVRSMSEQDLFLGSRGALAQKRRRQGRIDLSFEAGKTWRLGVELKFNDPARRGQQQRYPTVGRPVIFVVRNPPRLKEPDLDPGDAPHYLGAVAWEALLPRLHRLPVADAERAMWIAVLRVSELNGDFAPEPPRNASTKRDEEVLEHVLPPLRQRLSELLQRKHNATGRRFAESLTIDGPYPARTWANIGLLTSKGDVALWIDLRHTESTQPAWRVSWPRWHPIVHRKEYDRLRSEGVFGLSGEWWTATGTVAPAKWRSDPCSATVESIGDALAALVRSGVMERLVKAGR
jgi:hypothetical protein